MLAYLSRYTHRVAISNRRLIAADANSVTFNRSTWRSAPLPAFSPPTETMLTHVNAGIERLAPALVIKRREIASVIEEVVRRWDARTLSDRLELVVGSDLQYIRMNGTLVGAGVGALIFAASHLFRLR